NLILPPALPSIKRVTSLEVLGVTISYNLSVSEHISNLVSCSNSTLYALKTLKCKGLPFKALNIVSQATLISRLGYASPAWAGFTNSSDKQQLQGLFNKAHRWGLSSQGDISNLWSSADKKTLSLCN